MKRLYLMILGTSVCLLASSASVFAQTDNFFEPTGIGDWNTPGNWTINDVPSSEFGERAVIDTGGTATVSNNVPFSPGAILLGSALGNNSGSLIIQNGGTLGVNTIAPTAAQNGGISVGGTGNGSLTVLPGGTLTVAGALTSVANPANTIVFGSSAAGTANVTVGSATFNSSLQAFPNTNFLSNGAITFAGTNVYTAEINGANSPSFDATTTANLGGVLNVNFAGAPSVGSSWSLMEANAFAGAFASLTTNAALGPGQNLYLSTTDIGGGRERLDLNLQDVLVLQVDRNSGNGTIVRPGGSTISIDGYSVLSSQGSLVSSTWDSLASSGNLGGGWTESNPSASNLSELKASGSGSFSSMGQSVSLGRIYDPMASPFGFTGEDLTFEYTTPSGDIIPGIVEVTGTRVNNIILQIDPTTGQGRIRNLSNTAIDIDGYVINSGTNSIASGTWNSLDDQNIAGGEWLELLAINDSQIGEVDPLNATTLGTGGSPTLELGTVFKTAGSQDLTFQYLAAGTIVAAEGLVLYEPIVAVAGDRNVDDQVNGVDFFDWQRTTADSAYLAIWEQNYGGGGGGGSLSAASVPEPSSFVMALLVGSALMLSSGRSR